MFFGLTFWAPNVNIFRDPRWGSGQETYGEDPFLTGRMAVAFVTGMQGEDPKHFKVVSTPKHFAVHSGPEPLRHGFNVDVSPHDLEDTYLPAFRMAVTEAHAQSVMCAYNAVDGFPACASTMLLQDHLRDRLALRRLRRLRLRRGRRHRDRAQVRSRLRARLCRRRQGRHRSRVPVRQGRGLSRAGGGRREGPDRRGRDRPRREAAVQRPLPPGHVRSAGVVRLRPDPCLGGELGRAPQARPASRARGDRAAEERARLPAARGGHSQDRGRRTDGGAGAVAPGQLQRHAARPGLSPRRHRAPLQGREGPLRAGVHSRRGLRGADRPHGAARGRRQGGPDRRVLRLRRPQRQARRGARRSQR